MNTFTMLPNEIFNLNISDGAFKLYALLQRYCFGEKDSCFPGQATLAGELKRSVRTVQRLLSELVGSGLILIKRRGSTSNVYKLLKKVVAGVTSSVSGQDAFSSKSATVLSPSFERSNFEKDSSLEENIFSTQAKKGRKTSNNYKSKANSYNEKPSSFCDIPQRKYDFNKLEEALLGNNTALSYEDCINSGSL